MAIKWIFVAVIAALHVVAAVIGALLRRRRRRLRARAAAARAAAARAEAPGRP